VVFPIVIAENILNHEKPHELLPPDVSPMAITAVVLILTGAFLRVWARGHFERGRLFTTGPYAIVRHPLYLGSMLIVAGVLFQLSDWTNWLVVWPVFAIFYGAAVLYEERSLANRFGEQWNDYCATVPAIVPSLTNYLSAVSFRKWNWRLFKNSGELVTSLMALSIPILIEVMEEVVFEKMLHV
jgi:protein-S-isoprenylcysteine O-methyltransferase Ste14